MAHKVPAVVFATLIPAGMVRAQGSELWTPAGFNSEVAGDCEVIGSVLTKNITK